MPRRGLFGSKKEGGTLYHKKTNSAVTEFGAWKKKKFLGEDELTNFFIKKAKFQVQVSKKASNKDKQNAKKQEAADARSFAKLVIRNAKLREFARFMANGPNEGEKGTVKEVHENSPIQALNDGDKRKIKYGGKKAKLRLWTDKASEIIINLPKVTIDPKDVEVAKMKKNACIYYDKNVLTKKQAQRIMLVRSGELSEHKLNKHEKRNANLVSIVIPAKTFLNSAGKPYDKPLSRFDYHFTYPEFRRDGDMFYQKGKTITLSRWCQKNLEDVIRLNIKLVSEEAKKRGQILPFTLLAPGAFIDNITGTKRKVVQEAIEAAFLKVLKGLEPEEYSGISDFILNNSTKHKDFGWSQGTKGLGNRTHDILCKNAKSKEDSIPTVHIVKSVDITKIAEILGQQGLDAPSPSMGDGLGGLANGALGPTAQHGVDEFLARVSGLSVLLSGNKRYNTGLLKKMYDINDFSRHEEKSDDSEIESDDGIETEDEADEHSASSSGSDTPSSSVSSASSDHFLKSLKISKENIAVADFVHNKYSKSVPDKDEFNKKALAKLTKFKKTIQDNISNPNPKGAYRGIGVKAVRDEDGNLKIADIFSPKETRFKTATADGPQYINNKQLEGKTITHVLTSDGAKLVNSMSMKDIAKAFHSDGILQFKTLDGKVYGCDNRINKTAIFAQDTTNNKWGSFDEMLTKAPSAANKLINKLSRSESKEFSISY